MIKRELEELIGILCYKGWGFEMRKRFETDNKYVINVVLGSEELECDVNDSKGLKALAFDVVNFNRDEFEVCNIDGALGSLFNICVDTKHDIEVMSADDFNYKYNFTYSKECEWIVQINVDGVVYIMPYDNEKLIDVINIKLMPEEVGKLSHNGVEIYVNYISGVPTYNVKIGYVLMAFDNIRDAKKFIENNVKGE